MTYGRSCLTQQERRNHDQTNRVKRSLYLHSRKSIQIRSNRFNNTLAVSKMLTLLLQCTIIIVMPNKYQYTKLFFFCFCGWCIYICAVPNPKLNETHEYDIRRRIVTNYMCVRQVQYNLLWLYGKYICSLCLQCVLLAITFRIKQLNWKMLDIMQI